MYFLIGCLTTLTIFRSFSGTTAAHCSGGDSPPTSPPVSGPTTVTPPPSPVATCGGGSTGNGICADPNHCCSQYGHW